jgi:hypothetical protein
MSLHDKIIYSKSIKRFIPMIAVLVIAGFLVANALAPPMVTLAFISSWTSESIYQLTVTVQNPSTYAYTVYYLTATNMSSGITIPAGYTLTNILAYDNQSASRFTSTVKPETDSFVQYNLTSPSATITTQTSLVTPYAYSGADVLIGLGYNSTASYYYTIGQWSGVLSLTTGTWTITITDYTQ